MDINKAMDRYRAFKEGIVKRGGKIKSESGSRNLKVTEVRGFGKRTKHRKSKPKSKRKHRKSKSNRRL